MRERTIFLLVIASLLLVGLGFAASVSLNLMPDQASTRAVLVDQLFHVMLGVATVIFLLVEGALVFAVLRFRHREGDESDALPAGDNPSLEIIWTLLPALIVVVIGIYSFRVLTQIEVQPDDSMVVEVTARQFSWEFHYPDLDLTSSELHLPVGQTVRFEITSKDVIHSFWVPAFRAKRDATPGQVSELVITPSKEGRYPVRCAELCGVGHAGMFTDAVVESQDAFDAWVESVSSLPSDPVEAGRFVFQKFQCFSCHTLTDAGATGTVGPVLDGIGARAGTRVPGLEAIEYIKQSILDPGAFVVPGFPDGLMPRDFHTRMTTEEFEAIVNYLLHQ